MNFPLMIIETLYESDVIKQFVDNRMRAYTEPFDKSGAFIMVIPVSPASATAAASNNFLAEQQHMQIDVQGTNFDEVQTVADEIRRVLHEEFNMLAQGDGLDTYFEETSRFLVSRNYIGTPQKLNYQSKVI